MTLNECFDGATCVCPTVSTNIADCYAISGYVTLRVFIVTAIAFSLWFTWSTFFKTSPTESAGQRLQRQKIYWILLACFTVTQILMALTLHQDDPIQLMAWLALAVLTGLGFTFWSLRRKRA